MIKNKCSVAVTNMCGNQNHVKLLRCDCDLYCVNQQYEMINVQHTFAVVL